MYTRVCPPVQEIIHSLKLVDYLHIQADKPWYNEICTLTTNVPTVSATTVLCMAFLAEDDGGIGGIEGGGIDGNPPGIVEQESSSSGDRSGLGGEGAGDVVRVGNAGVGGIMKCKGE